MIRTLNRLALAGMLLGIMLVVQPLWHSGLRVGFFITLITTIAYIIISHIPDRSGISSNSEGPTQ